MNCKYCDKRFQPSYIIRHQLNCSFKTQKHNQQHPPVNHIEQTCTTINHNNTITSSIVNPTTQINSTSNRNETNNRIITNNSTIHINDTSDDEMDLDFFNDESDNDEDNMSECNNLSHHNNLPINNSSNSFNSFKKLSLMQLYPQQIIGLQLYHILDRAGSPAYLYDDIKDVIENAVSLYSNNPNLPPIPRRIGLINDMKRILVPDDDALQLEVITEEITLKGTDVKLVVPRFSFLSVLHSLLSDVSLMNHRNTLYHLDEYTKPDVVSDTFNDIHTGNAFQNLLKYYTQTMSRNNKDSPFVICGIIAFVDAVSPDKLFKHQIEPFSITLSLFNRNTRNYSKAWRNLGYIPNPESHTKLDYKTVPNKNRTLLKRIHYHQIISVILKDLLIIQKTHSGIRWSLPFPNNNEELDMRIVELKVPFLYIIGDAVGNDKLVGRKGTYNSQKTPFKGACRDCKILFKHCNDPFAVCLPANLEEIKDATKEEKEIMNF